MTAKRFICGDWGTTHLRLYLCDGAQVIEERRGPGITACKGNFAGTLFDSIRGWSRADERLPVVLAGMIGSRNGWHEVGYAECPANPASLRASLYRFELHGHRIAIVPGLACTNPLGAPDVMRGEETQIVGAVALAPELASGRHLIALPGTHCKWVELADGTVERFQTSVSGELYSVLRAHSILIGVGAATFDFASYEVGVRKAIEHPEAPLHHLVFEARSRQLRSGWSPAQASAFVSGLIIGSDVRAALGAHPATQAVYVIGAPEVAGLYSRVLEMLEVTVKPLDGSATVVAGLKALAEE